MLAAADSELGLITRTRWGGVGDLLARISISSTSLVASDDNLGVHVLSEVRNISLGTEEHRKAVLWCSLVLMQGLLLFASMIITRLGAGQN